MPNSTLAQMGFLDEQTQQETVYDLEDTQARSDIGTINGKIPSGASSSNKMATASDITAINNKISSAASSTNKLVDTTAMNNAIGSAVAATYKAAGNKTVAELTSSLLVADNRGKVYNMTDSGITTADFVEGAGYPIRVGDDVGICEPTTGTFKFNLLSGFIAVDTNPTQGSANPVSSGGVRTELDGKISKSSTIGYVKNDGTIDTDLGTIVANKVDKVTGKGLSTNDYTNTAKGIVDNIQDNVIANTKLIKDTVGWSGKNLLNWDKAKYWFNGTGATFSYGDKCINIIGGTITNEFIYPSEATYQSSYDLKPNTKYIISCGEQGISGLALQVYYKETLSSNWVKMKEVKGEAFMEFTTPSTFALLWVRFEAHANVTIGSGTIYPMIYDANILDSTYEPYFGSTAFPRSEQVVLGAKNLLRNTASSKSFNNVNFTVNADKSITVNTSAAASNVATLDIINGITGLDGTFVLSGVTGGATNTFGMQIQDLTTSQWGDYCIDGDVSVTLNGSHSYRFIIYVRAGVTVSNKTIYPMLRLVTDPDDTYVPHAMTNKELTDKVTPKNTTITYESGISQNVPNSIAMVTVGNIVILNTDLVGVVAEKSAWVSLGTVPASIKPSVYKTMNALLNAKTDVCDCQITNEGVLRIRNNSNAIVSTDIVHVNGVYFFNIT